MERNAAKNGLVNLIAAVMISIAAFAVTGYVNSLAGQVASVFLGLASLVAFASWFQMRLEENERLEKLELDELVKSKLIGEIPAAPAGMKIVYDSTAGQVKVVRE